MTRTVAVAYCALIAVVSALFALLLIAAGGAL